MTDGQSHITMCSSRAEGMFSIFSIHTASLGDPQFWGLWYDLLIWSRCIYHSPQFHIEFSAILLKCSLSSSCFSKIITDTPHTNLLEKMFVLKELKTQWVTFSYHLLLVIWQIFYGILSWNLKKSSTPLCWKKKTEMLYIPAK